MLTLGRVAFVANPALALAILGGLAPATAVGCGFSAGKKRGNESGEERAERTSPRARCTECAGKTIESVGVHGTPASLRRTTGERHTHPGAVGDGLDRVRRARRRRRGEELQEGAAPDRVGSKTLAL